MYYKLPEVPGYKKNNREKVYANVEKRKKEKGIVKCLQMGTNKVKQWFCKLANSKVIKSK